MKEMKLGSNPASLALESTFLSMSSRAAPVKSGVHARGEGERVLALESREGIFTY